jgi:glycine/D-amino acid oxidase-like deaminating enzyme
MASHTAPKSLVIVGGGIQGASIAFWASKLSPSTHITVLEANDRVAPHASGKGGGFLARSWGDQTITEQLHHNSFDLHEQLAKEWGLESYRRLPVLSVGAGTRTFDKKAAFHPGG